MPGALESSATDAAGRVFITVEDLAEIVVIDARNRAIVAHWPMQGCEGSTGLVLDTADHRLVAACANGKAKIVSSGNGAFIASVTIGPRPGRTCL